jgi:predicted N-acetyltransferase YhbS
VEEHVDIQFVGPEAAEDVYRVTKLAFAAYTWLEPPSGALRETLEDVRRELAHHGGVVARRDGRVVAAARFHPEQGYLRIRRVGVEPGEQNRGVGTSLMQKIAEAAATSGWREMRIGVRVLLPRNKRFYERLGYRRVALHHDAGSNRPHWWDMSLPLGPSTEGTSAEPAPAVSASPPAPPS